MAKIYFEYREGDSMQGPYRLTFANVDKFDGEEFGVYVLCDDDEDLTMRLVVYVGRGILKNRLEQHCAANRAKYFYFCTRQNDRRAFITECRLFHEYGKRKHLDNRIHPAAPAGLPKCSEVGCQGEAD